MFQFDYKAFYEQSVQVGERFWTEQPALAIVAGGLFAVFVLLVFARLFAWMFCSKKHCHKPQTTTCPHCAHMTQVHSQLINALLSRSSGVTEVKSLCETTLRIVQSQCDNVLSHLQEGQEQALEKVISATNKAMDRVGDMGDKMGELSEQCINLKNEEED